MTKLYYLIIIITLMFSISACQDKAKGKAPKIQNQLTIPDKGFEFELIQRNSIEIPSKKGGLSCQIDDITRGQTLLIIKQDSIILLEKSIRNGTNEQFTLSGKKYGIECLDMVNLLVGDDHCFFRIKSIK